MNLDYLADKLHETAVEKGFWDALGSLPQEDKFIFYATGFGVKTNMGEKAILIDAHLAENDRSLELIESYIEFLRDTVKNLESFSYSIKNMIELMNYLGR